MAKIWKQYSGMWTTTQQMQAIGAENWPGFSLPGLFGWGSNTSGRLGVPVIQSYSSPVQVGSGTWSLLKIGPRSGTGGAINSSGILYLWGRNNNGQIGDGTTNYRSSPTQIGSSQWISIAGTGDTTAGVTSDNKLFTWGDGRLGLLADNIGSSAFSRSSPVQVGTLTNWLQVAGADVNFAAIKTDGTLWTWGNGPAGTNGDGTTISRSSPVQVGALTNWAQVSGGDNGMMAVKTDNTLWGWGENTSGLLGTGNTTNYSSPVQIGALTDWDYVSCGVTSSYAIKTDGTLWAWGSGAGGALGVSSTVNYSSPIQIGALTNWTRVAAGFQNCAAVRSDSTGWTWGRNGVGQLGHNNTIYKSSPVQVSGSYRWTDIVVFSDSATMNAIGESYIPG